MNLFFPLTVFFLLYKKRRKKVLNLKLRCVRLVMRIRSRPDREKAVPEMPSHARQRTYSFDCSFPRCVNWCCSFRITYCIVHVMMVSVCTYRASNGLKCTTTQGVCIQDENGTSPTVDLFISDASAPAVPGDGRHSRRLPGRLYGGSSRLPQWEMHPNVYSAKVRPT